VEPRHLGQAKTELQAPEIAFQTGDGERRGAAAVTLRTLPSIVKSSDARVPAVSDLRPTMRWRRRSSMLAGGAGAVSTAADYPRFSQMLLNGDQLDGTRILSRAWIALMTSGHLGSRISSAISRIERPASSIAATQAASMSSTVLTVQSARPSTIASRALG
jgi:CubicO group peptidase (beta-lactamase class C family)